MPTIELPGDNKAEIRDPESLTRADVHRVHKLIDESGIDYNHPGVDLIGAAQDALVVVLAESWTLPGDITLATLAALPAKTFAPLGKAVKAGLSDVLVGDMVDPTTANGSSKPSTAV